MTKSYCCCKCKLLNAINVDILMYVCHLSYTSTCDHLTILIMLFRSSSRLDRIETHFDVLEILSIRSLADNSRMALTRFYENHFQTNWYIYFTEIFIMKSNQITRTKKNITIINESSVLITPRFKFKSTRASEHSFSCNWSSVVNTQIQLKLIFSETILRKSSIIFRNNNSATVQFEFKTIRVFERNIHL